MKRIILLLSCFGLVLNLFAQDAEDIVRRADQAMDYKTAYIEARMVNSDQFGAKTVDYRAWAKGSNFLMEFTSDAEFGQKILRTNDRIYHFFPDSESIFTKSKGDSIVGLISYDDITDEADMLDTYTVTLSSEETVQGVPCYVVRLRVRPGKRVAYPIQVVWIAKGTYTIWRVEMYTRSEQLLKTMEIRKVAEFDGIQMAVDILITDQVRKGVKSEIFIEDVVLDGEISDDRFTRRELTR